MRSRVGNAETAGCDLRAVVGFYLLAGLVWILPFALAQVRYPAQPQPKIIYSAGGPASFLWSPASPAHPPSAEGRVCDPAGRVLGPVGGWQGLLLGNRLDLNQASQEDLDALPGIGPKTAAAILETRRGLAGFRSYEDLLAVRGIGPKTLERLRPWVEVGGAE